MIVYRCDMCRQELRPNELYKAEIPRVLGINNVAQGRRDLCANCLLRLERYINNGGVQEEEELDDDSLREDLHQ